MSENVGGNSVRDCLLEALESAENEETLYWIRTALQLLEADEELEITSL